MDGVTRRPVLRVTAARREELLLLARRSKDVLLLAAVVGVITGLGVAAFDTAVNRGLEALDSAPLWIVAAAPLVGLAMTALILRSTHETPATADEYLLSFHNANHVIRIRSLVLRIIAGVATLGSGAPMGLEGPSLYLGAGTGTILQRHLPRIFSARNRRVLLVAGAAAGVAAIFKAPATGAVFALEVPYQDDLARRMLGPALVASATGYLAFVAFHGTAPLLIVAGSPPFSYRDLAAAAALGLVAGLGARWFAWLLRKSKELATRIPIWVRVPAGGAMLAVIFVLARLLTGESLTTGPGYDTIVWALDPGQGFWIVAGILALRVLGTATTVSSGGVGGLFIPLVVTGALAGRLVGGAIHTLDTSLFTVIGAAAFLGAGYRVPLASVMFVAEATGRPGFVVPGLIAAVVAELFMGTASVTSFQRDTTGSLEGEPPTATDAPPPPPAPEAPPPAPAPEPAAPPPAPAADAGTPPP